MTSSESLHEMGSSVNYKRLAIEREEEDEEKTSRQLNVS